GDSETGAPPPTRAARAAPGPRRRWRPGWRPRARATDRASRRAAAVPPACRPAPASAQRSYDASGSTHTSWTVELHATCQLRYIRGMARVLMPLPDRDFDPTETAVPWHMLTRDGHEIVFATEAGGAAPAGDPLLLDGKL